MANRYHGLGTPVKNGSCLVQGLAPISWQESSQQMGLKVEKELVYSFFEKFARFECAMKFRDYCARDRHGNAIPDWEELKKSLGPKLSTTKDPGLVEALTYLTAKPPKVQLFEDGRAVFHARPLPDADIGTQALESAKRVRNNLFHGGKHTGHKDDEERDSTLLRHAALVIEEAAKLDEGFYWDYRGIA